MSVLASFPLERIKGLVLSRAGRTSHVSIIARSYQIPMVSGISNLRDLIETGDRLRVDGTNGIVEIGVRENQEVSSKEKADTIPIVFDRGPCILKDQIQISIFANTEFSSEVGPALNMGAEGIGLFRTEFLYMKQGKFVLDEEKHFSVYRELAEQLGKLPATIRTLDIAEEAGANLRQEAGEEGAVLGIRGIRVSLRNPEMFKSQIRAILRASEFGNLQIVLPMISSLDELIEAKSLINQTKLEIEPAVNRMIPVGVLIEVPAAILTLEEISRECDFLAVGTNDLIQYTLAAGRLNDEVSDLYNPLHPAVLRSLERVVQVGRSERRPVFVCGEMAAHPVFCAILVGLGFRNLSMNAVAIPQVKKTLAGFDSKKLTETAMDLTRISRLTEIGELIKKRFGTAFSETI
jgi:phosphotransferase system enzyme I (PtsI)